MKLFFTPIITFTNLHLPETVQAAKEALKGRIGVYAIVCLVTGAVYIGSSINLDERFADHFVEFITNPHLQNAIASYGLEKYIFSVIEFVSDKAQLIVREQHYLDILFKSFPAALIYNFLTKAYSLLGFKHSKETKAKISASALASENSGRFQFGANPKYGIGKVPTNAVGVNIYTIDKVFIKSFSSQVEAAKWLGVSNYTVSVYIKSGKVLQGKYLLRSSK